MVIVTPELEASQDEFCGKLLRRPPNSELRPREYLLPDEVDRLLAAAKKSPGRHGHRNYCLVLLMYRHGLRVSEACLLQWSQIDFKGCTLHFKRLKQGKSTRPASHPIEGKEIQALRQLRKQYPDSIYLFNSERQGTLSRYSVVKIIKDLGKEAGIEFSVHPHMLRHSCGYAMVNQGVDIRVIQAYLGHRSLQTTALYTELAPEQFRGIWRD